MTEHALRMRQGDREIAVDEARVRALAADGKLSETAEIWDEESNRWLPAPRWYLLRSRIVARPDTDDDRYIAAHRAGELDMTSLVGLLGVSLADAEGRLHVEDGPPGGAIDLSASETRIEVDFGHDDGDARDEAIATVRAGRADERIEVPSWGRPWLLPQSRPIPVPEWKDPATARIELPPWEPPVWAAMPQPESTHAKARTVQPSADAAPGASAASPTKGELDPERRAQLVERRRALRALRAARAAQASEREALIAQTDGRVREEIAAIEAAAEAEARAARAAAKAEARAAKQRAAEATAEAAAEAARRAEAAAAQQAFVDAGGAATAAVAAAAGLGETKTHWGCAGCLVQLVALGVLGFAAMIATEKAVEHFVQSPVAEEIAGKAPQVASRHTPRALHGLVAIGPQSSVLPIVVAFDPADDAGIRTLRAAMTWLGRGLHGGLAGTRAPRLVLLPLGGAEHPVTRHLFALDALGVLTAHEEGAGALDALIAGDGGLTVDAVAKRAQALGIDGPTLQRALDEPTVVERASQSARVAAAFDLGAPAAVAVAARALPPAALGSQRALDIALSSAARVAHARFTVATPANAWKQALSAVDAARAERWLAWIVRGERLGGAGREAPAATAGPVRLEVPTSAPRRGVPDGVQVVAVVDLHCPYSAKLWAALDRSLSRRKDDVELVLIHYPITRLHPQAEEAARLMQALWLEDAPPGHWRVVKGAFGKLGKIETKHWLRRAGRASGRDAVAALEVRAKSAEVSGALVEHRSWAQEHGVTGTPTLFVDGALHKGARSRESLDAILDAAVAARAAATHQALPAESTPTAP